MNKETGGSAFPVERQVIAEQYGSKGMTLRDYFAAKAMQTFAQEYVYDNSDEIADKAYTLADAMLEARK